jgi:hypothetical protein
MAKQPSKSARADSSAGESAAAVSSNTDAVAAAAPTVLADARSALLSDVRDMQEVSAQLVADLEARARNAAQAFDHAEHTLFSRLASVVAEFRAGLATVLNAPQV